MDALYRLANEVCDRKHRELERQILGIKIFAHGDRVGDHQLVDVLFLLETLDAARREREVRYVRMDALRAAGLEKLRRRLKLRYGITSLAGIL